PDAATYLMAAPSYERYKSLLGGHRLPAAFVDLEALEANARLLLAAAGKLPVRIASKSVRSVAVLRHILSLSPQFQGVLCFSAEEAVFLADQGLDDLVVAYPTVQPEAVRAVCAHVQRGRRLTLMVDGPAQIEQLAQIALHYSRPLPVAIDIDMASDFPGVHFGVWRSPVRSAEAVVALWKLIRQYPQLTLDGVMGYEAQLAGVGDAVPGQGFMNGMMSFLKRRSAPEVFARRAALVAALRAEGASLRFVNGGGTGSLASTGTDESVTELAAGSGFFCPVLFDFYKDLHLQPAAFFALEVCRIASPNRVTCLGGGYIGSGAPGLQKLPQPYFPFGLRLDTNEGAGEVQTPLILPDSVRLRTGDPVIFRHAKAGELCERFNELLLVRGQRIEARVPTYRGQGQCFV
ncbi:MAG: alanine racemase, partial [Moraxellaceae bacterium]|nr:alanine racemase [Moraxellaceae bacterium]